MRDVRRLIVHCVTPVRGITRFCTQQSTPSRGMKGHASIRKRRTWRSRRRFVYSVEFCTIENPALTIFEGGDQCPATERKAEELAKETRVVRATALPLSPRKRRRETGWQP